LKINRLHTAEEQALWNQFKAGDRIAFTRLMQTYYRDLFQYATKFTKDGELIKDCLQDLFLELWKKRSTLGETNYVKAYLLKAVRHKLYRQLYKNQRHTQAQPLDDNYCFDVVFSVEQLQIREEEVLHVTEKLTTLLNQLPRRQKEIIYLRFFQELEVEQIVQVMEINPQSAYNLLHKAIHRLRQSWIGEKETLAIGLFIYTYFFGELSQFWI
jgi:RNA polymerase sigma factor (sigma-70 family)